ncbi:MAG TPA: hypothetical protein VIN57_06615 [Magnetovibrio sp.]
MNASRAKCSLAVALLSAGVLMSVPALAQSGPVDLSPPTRTTPEEPTQPAVKSPPLTPPSMIGAEGVTMEAPIMGDTVESETLGQIDPDVAGSLSADDGGFGLAMWWGTDRRVIETFMAQLPVRSPSPAMRNLMRRLLLTGAEVPSGGKPGSLIALRADLLATMGDFDGVNALLGAVPGYSGNAELLRVEMDSRLLTGDVARACQMAHAHIESQNTIYWQKAFTFCQAIEGQQQAALLGLGLLEELNVDDPVFFQLVQTIAREGKPPTIESLAEPTPLHLAMARIAKAQLPSDVISSNRPGVLRAIAISPNASAELRLEAAERAEMAGALETDALRQIYASIEFSEDDLKNPLTVAATHSGPMSRALLYRATLSQSVPAAQAEALSSALELARAGGRYASTARAFLPQLSRVEASADLVWFAPEAVRAYLITAHPQEARAWFDLLESAARHDSETARALEQLMPVARLSGFAGADDWTMDKLPKWWASIKDTAGARDKAAMLTAALDALGEYVPESMWVELIDGPTHQSIAAPYPALRFLLDGASSQARIGETVMLSLVVLSDGGLAGSDPAVVHRVLKALRNIGLNDEARALALEAVVAAGL